MSVIVITPNTPISIHSWKDFCSKHGIEFLSIVPGQRTFRVIGDDIRIIFGHEDGKIGFTTSPNGYEPVYISDDTAYYFDYANASPPLQADRFILFTHSDRLWDVYVLARQILAKWPSEVSYDREYKSFFNGSVGNDPYPGQDKGSFS